MMRLLRSALTENVQQQHQRLRSFLSFIICLLMVTVVPSGVDAQEAEKDDESSSSFISSTLPCGLCPNTGTQLKAHHVPLSWTASMTRTAPEMFVDYSFLVNDKVFSAEMTNNLTCQEWDTFASTEFHNDSMPQCLDLRDYLGGPCCNDPNHVLPPLYSCQAAAQDVTIGNTSLWYKTNMAPTLVDVPRTLQVQVQMDVLNAEVLDHGVNGGTIAVWGEFSMTWIDERLQFPNVAKEMNCYSYSVSGTSIWVPALKGVTRMASGGGSSSNSPNAHDRSSAAEQEEEGEESQLVHLPESEAVIVLADGRVEDSFWGHAIMHCTTLSGASKECKMSWQDNSGNRNVVYVQRQGKGITNGVFVRNPIRMPPKGYKMNETATALNIHAGATLGPAVQVVDFIMRFDPLEDDCNVCGDDDSVTLLPNLIPNQPLQWLEHFPNQDGWTCQQLDEFLTDLTVGNESCTTGRAFFQEACCDDDRSSFECESSIHSALAQQGVNTVTPPDPSPKEKHTVADDSTEDDAVEDDFVDVSVSIDVSHVMGLDVKANTMELLISLELEWYDDRLSWEPFLGGCQRASLRASLDADQTEIWVPHLELINMADTGSNNLPEASASVMYDGRVMWRRTGVLSVTCKLTGIENFPFDSAGCFLEFGGTRNPLFHRVKYVPRGIQYTPRVKEAAWNFQEYKLNTNKTEVIMHTEEISGFSNEIIRYQFYFDRAVGFYVNMFILLYIIFTIMSFGMFFIDYRLGERLGYASSILFVIVAQDITMSEFTPVTQEFLWIYKLSLGSKIFVILGIVQSIITLYIFNHDDDDDDDDKNMTDVSDAAQEKRPFLESADARSELLDTPRLSTLDFIEEDPEEQQVNENGNLGNAFRQSTLTASSEDDEGKVATSGLNQGGQEQDQQDSAAYGPERPRQGKGRRGSSFSLSKSPASHVIKSTVKTIVGEHLIPSKEESKKKQKIKKLLIVDKITAMCFVLAYSIFLLIMFGILRK